MKKCTHCSYPNPDSRATCFKCQADLPEPTPPPPSGWKKADGFLEDLLLKSRGIRGAAEDGDVQRVRAILQEKPDAVNESSATGVTALFLAARHGHRDVVAALLQSGADPDSRLQVRPNVLGYGILSGQILPVLCSLKVTQSPLDEACRRGHAEIAGMLLAAGAKPSGENLCWAAQAGQKDVAEALLRFGAGINGGKRCGELTPLGLALRGRHNDVADLLRRHGAKHTRFMAPAYRYCCFLPVLVFGGLFTILTVIGLVYAALVTR